MKSRSRPLTASTADKFVLYQKAVQAPEAEIEFIERVFRRRFGSMPTQLREDFCGTALLCFEWAKRRRANIAYGVDLHGPTLTWALENGLSRAPPDRARRIRLVEGDVLRTHTPPADVVCALNFSYFTFRDARALTAYFRSAKRSLRRRGLLVLDAYGGYEAQQTLCERTRRRGFTYVWEQVEYNPVEDYTRCHIHFEFPDGTALHQAFTYHWRLWTLGGIRDCLAAAGFSSVDVYWEGDDGRGSGSGVFRRARRAENCAGWIAYLVAER